MQIKIKRIDKDLPLPKYETEGAVAFDLYARVDIEIPARQIGRIPLNIIIEFPKTYAFIVVPRSSTPERKGLLSPHGIGVIDHDYHGENDEVMFQVYNFTDKTVKVAKGERLAQGMFVRVDKAEFVENEQVERNSRGGFGSTG